MSKKVLDQKGRWRSKSVAFRMSPEEAQQLDVNVKLSGLNKQDYLIRRALQQEVKVVGNPRVYKSLKNELAAVLNELRRIEAGTAIDNELLDTIELIAAIMGGMKEGGKSL